MQERLGRRGVLAGVVGVFALLSACGPTHPPVPYGLEGGTYFLCCTVRFNADHEANDASYRYEQGTTLTAGTAVQVTREGDRIVELQPTGGTQRFNLIFRFGRNVITAGQFFDEMLLREDPRTTLGRLSREVADAVSRGELRAGMTKAEAIAARGYPPRHRTSSTDADDWIYYETREQILRVRFERGVVVAMTLDQAPGS